MSLTVFINGTSDYGMGIGISAGAYFMVSVEESMFMMGSMDGIEHDREVTTGRIFHTHRLIDAACHKTMLLVFN